MENLIRVAAFDGFITLVRELGADPVQIIEQVNITPQQLHNADDLISSTAFVAALQIAAVETRHPDFGLRLGQRQGINMLGPVGILARQCNTVKEAFTVSSRYIKLHNPGAVIELQTNSRQALLCYDDTTPGLPRNPQICDLGLVLAVDLLRFFMGKSWRAKAVFFVHNEPEDISIYQEIFKAPLFFDQEVYAVEFDASILEARVPQADPEVRDFFFRYVGQLDKKYNQDVCFVVTQLIRSLLGTRRCSEEEIASVLQINRRTLQRKLQAEGLSFRQLLAQIRGELAEQYLRESTISVTDLASILGYSELSAFTRFFKNRFGVSPTQYRATEIERHYLARQ